MPLRSSLLPALVSSSLLVAAAPLAIAQTVTLTVDDTVLAPKSRIGIGVNGGGGWYNFVGANLVDNSCFEAPADADGFSQRGWPWGSTNAGALTASVDDTVAASGQQSQKLVVTGAPVAIRQGRADLPQQPLVMQVTPDGSYVIKARVRTQDAGASIRLGFLVDSWTPTLSDPIAVTTEWADYSWSYVPDAAAPLIGVAIEFETNTTYWIDDVIAWNENDIDPETGLSATYVERLKDMHPATLRLGGLGVNGIPLESYLFEPWDLSYGPPAFLEDMGLNTFLKLCRTVGADPFLVVPPAFSDPSHAAVGDLTDDIVDNYFTDHGNLVDYLGGDDSTTYGARREADGYGRWDLEFDTIYLELGNELWGTPDGAWDMRLDSEDLLTQMQRFVRYNQARMGEMRARPGWRDNMRVGFCGRGPETWIGDWAGSYNVTVVPALADLTDFSTISMYYGPEDSSTDDALFGDLFAHAPWYERAVAAMKDSFATAAGHDVETTVYEGAAVWGPYSAHLDPTIYAKEVSLGAAVSVLDSFAAGNRAGITVNNLFHFSGNVWATITGYPEDYRKPTFLAVQMFTEHLAGDLVTCTVNGSDTYVSNLPDEPPVPYVACYPYKDEDQYRILIVNRHRSESQSITIDEPLVPVELVELTAPDINANNEDGEQVTLAVDALDSVPVDSYDLEVPPFSAAILVGYENTQTPPAITSPTALADGVVDVAYEPVVFAATGTQVLEWSVSAGDLPPGMSFDAATATYSGTPTQVGTYDFTIQVENAYGTDTVTLEHVILDASGPGGDDGGGGCCRVGTSKREHLGDLFLLVAILLANRRRRKPHTTLPHRPPRSGSNADE